MTRTRHKCAICGRRAAGPRIFACGCSGTWLVEAYAYRFDICHSCRPFTEPVFRAGYRTLTLDSYLF